VLVGEVVLPVTDDAAAQCCAALGMHPSRDSPPLCVVERPADVPRDAIDRPALRRRVTTPGGTYEILELQDQHP